MARCLAAGTLIRTPSGDVAAEEIEAASSIVVLRDGKEIAEPVKWVGQRYVDIKRHPRPEEVAPVRIRAGAISESVPSKDLLISPEHAVYLDSGLVQARALINGGSIVQERAAASVTYYHFELENHGVFFADELAVESYLDNGDRTFFEADMQPIMLHPVLTPFAEVDIRKTDACCAPFVTEPEAVKPIWARLAARSVELGYSSPELETTEDAELRIMVGQEALQPLSHANGKVVFVTPAGTASVTLASRFAIPSDLAPYADDARRLGIAVRSIVIRAGDDERIISPDAPFEAQGWYEAEQASATVWRWSDGAGELSLKDVNGPALVTVNYTTVGAYPLYDDRAQPKRKAA